MVLKATAQEAEYKVIGVKPSLMRKCKSVQVRSDLGDCGVYMMTQQFYRLLNYVQTEHSEMEAWSEMKDHVLPFFARNQFKEQLKKLSEEANKDKYKKSQGSQASKETISRIQAMMNPSQELDKDSIKVMGHIDSAHSSHTYLRMRNLNSFIRANLDGIKAINLSKKTTGLFRPTPNSLPNYQDLGDQQV